MSKYVIVLLGYSSSGKNSVLDAMMLKSNVFTNLVSHTTRPIRDTEQDKKDYYFHTKESFDKVKMIEKRVYHTVYGDWEYGLSEKELKDKLSNNKIPVVILDYNGMKEFKEWCRKHDVEVLSAYIHVPFIIRTYRAYKRGNFTWKEWIRREIADRKSFKGAKDSMTVIKNRNLQKCTDLIIKHVTNYITHKDGR